MTKRAALVLSLVLGSRAYAVDCMYFPEGKAKEQEKVNFEKFGPRDEFLVAKFTGPKPSLYFIAKKLKFAPSEQSLYTQIAEIADQREAPVLKVKTSSVIKAFSEWKNGNKTYRIMCENKNNEMGG